ncbi:glycosyltransferase family 4 protein [Devosia sp. MC1541]|uniref:glycosyltransferase family 4 protein n=1 Tax=Devosia sp. MC1541 TaxID=2725264 RepID=UPI00145ED491|nr:glycosyltransferase family 4 protein [Devosia sp. MC1541]
MKTIQIGLDWLSDRAGGLPRYYNELWRASDGVFGFVGMVLGTDNVGDETKGAVVAFAKPKASFAATIIGARRSFRALKATVEPNLVASHFALSTLPVLGQIDTPLVSHFHGPWAQEGIASGQNRVQAALKFHIEKQVYKRTDRAIVLSSAFADVLEKTYTFARSRIDIVPGGVDISRFNSSTSRREAREILGWSESRFIAACVRRLVPRMGHTTVLAAAEILRSRAPDVEIKLVGSGPLGSSLSAVIQAQELEKHVQLIGHVPDEHLPLVYRAADITIVPSIALEGFGLVVLESLAAGTPVVVTDVGGLAELMLPFAPQLIVPAAHSNALADAITAAMLSQNLPSALECQAYAAGFDWPIIARQIRDAYERAL